MGERATAARGKRASILALAVGVLLLAMLTSRSGGAQSDEVPADVQAELFAKLAGYDRNFAARAGGTARILIVERRDDAKSRLSAIEMKAALGRVDRVGGLPHSEVIEAYAGADALADRCRNGPIAAVYVTPDLDDELARLRVALAGTSVITFSSVPAYVPNGIVLGFDLEAGKPKILVNLEQARLQKVDFPADVLRLTRVYR